MTCEDLERRLYDEDCRSALVECRAAPPDVAIHLVTCEACRETWHTEQLAMRAFREGLAQPLPAGLRASLQMIPRRERVLSRASDARLASRALAAGAVAAAMVAAVSPAAASWQLAVFGTVAGGTLITLLVQKTGLSAQMRRLLMCAGSMSRGAGRLRPLPRQS